MILADKNREGILNWLQEEFPGVGAGSRCHVLACDVTQNEQVQEMIQEADDRSAQAADFLVNCAGITRDGWVSNLDAEDWDDVIDVNLKGTFLTCKHFLNRERLQRAPKIHQRSIVNIGSVVSEFGNLGQTNYAASKGGVLGLTRSLAKESAWLGVRVNAVLPGFIDTPMAQAVPRDIKEKVILPKIPIGRFGTPEEVADTVAFLLSPRSSYITGESIRVSGMISL